MPHVVCPNCMMPLSDPEICEYCEWKRVPSPYDLIERSGICTPIECSRSSARVYTTRGLSVDNGVTHCHRRGHVAKDNDKLSLLTM